MTRVGNGHFRNYVVLCGNQADVQFHDQQCVWYLFGDILGSFKIDSEVQVPVS